LKRTTVKEICNQNGIAVGQYNMATRNQSSGTYWANPNVSRLKLDWWLLLYDDLKNEIHVFMVPANSIPVNAVKIRNDGSKPNHIRIEIRYGDDSFEDTQSKIKFIPWYIKTLPIEPVRPAVFPDELLDDSVEYLEGTKKTVAVNTYERNPIARRLCINHYGSVCFICRFDFGKVYGKECEGLIHVHHLKKISEMNGQHTIDPVNDLRPVCPNCHMVLHCKKDGYTVEEVEAMLN